MYLSNIVCSSLVEKIRNIIIKLRYILLLLLTHSIRLAHIEALYHHRETSESNPLSMYSNAKKKWNIILTTGKAKTSPS